MQANFLTTKQLATRWSVSTRTLQNWRRDPEHPLRFDVDRTPHHPTVGKGYSLALVERVERSWRVG
jgi:hypothetical protein